MKGPKFKIGEQVRWKSHTLVVQSVRNYRGFWVYDFFPTTNTLVPFHFTGISEWEIIVPAQKRWWEFWK